MTIYKGLEDAAANIKEICQEFIQACKDKTTLDTLEVYQKLARQEHDIRSELNSLQLQGYEVICPKCKSNNVDKVDADMYLEILRCKCWDCGQFFIENIE